MRSKPRASGTHHRKKPRLSSLATTDNRSLSCCAVFRLPDLSDFASACCASPVFNTYGPNAALVVRDTSGGDWDWDDVIPVIRSRLDLSTSPFSDGIWVLSRAKDRLFQIA